MTPGGMKVGPMFGGAPPGPRPWMMPFCICSLCTRRTSLGYARVTKRGLPWNIRFCFSAIALLASSWVEKHTKPNPRDTLDSSRITLTDVMVPNGLNSLRSASSSTSSERLRTYTFRPLYCLMRS